MERIVSLDLLPFEKANIAPHPQSKDLYNTDTGDMYQSIEDLVSVFRSPIPEDFWAEIQAKKHDCTPEQIKFYWSYGRKTTFWTLNKYYNKLLQYLLDEVESNPEDFKLSELKRSSLPSEVKRDFSPSPDENEQRRTNYIIYTVPYRVASQIPYAVFNDRVCRLYAFRYQHGFDFMHSAGQTMMSPCERLYDTSRTFYELVLSIQRLIIEQRGFKVIHMYIVGFDRDWNLEFIPATYRTNNAHLLLETRHEYIKSHINTLPA